MRILVLGQGKMGKLVVQVATGRGHDVCGLDVPENADAAALTPEYLAGFDVAIDFTTPDAVVANMRACLGAGSKIVVGTTGWYAALPEMRPRFSSRASSKASVGGVTQFSGIAPNTRSPCRRVVIGSGRRASLTA